MRIVCAPDSFKESMSARQAAEAMARGVLAALPSADCVAIPLADGGEGTAVTLVEALGGVLKPVLVHDALGRPVMGHFGFVSVDALAIVEVASACGLELLGLDERDALTSSTAGVGELVRAALDAGARRLLIGLGGSATNDAGSGMLTELGVRFLDAQGAQLPPGGAALLDLRSVDASGLDPRLAGTEIQVMCDVRNPLVGPDGASNVFGPQKGASPADVILLDAALARWADVVERDRHSVREVPGAGAAGGLGAALLAFTHATLRPGIDAVLDAVGFDSLIAHADLVLTGEGSVDRQSRAGKAPFGVAARAEAIGVPVVILAGRVDEAVGPPDGSILAFVSIVPGPCTLAEALANGPINLARTTETVVRLLASAMGRQDAH